ncbi:hypothetical protein BaRGS_00022757, partial [Batillaria attramentaria]
MSQSPRSPTSPAAIRSEYGLSHVKQSAKEFLAVLRCTSCVPIKHIEIDKTREQLEVSQMFTAGLRLQDHSITIRIWMGLSAVLLSIPPLTIMSHQRLKSRIRRLLVYWLRQKRPESLQAKRTSHLVKLHLVLQARLYRETDHANTQAAAVGGAENLSDQEVPMLILLARDDQSKMKPEPSQIYNHPQDPESAEPRNGGVDVNVADKQEEATFLVVAVARDQSQGDTSDMKLEPHQLQMDHFAHGASSSESPACTSDSGNEHTLQNQADTSPAVQNDHEFGYRMLSICSRRASSETVDTAPGTYENNNADVVHNFPGRIQSAIFPPSAFSFRDETDASQTPGFSTQTSATVLLAPPSPRLASPQILRILVGGMLASSAASSVGQNDNSLDVTTTAAISCYRPIQPKPSPASTPPSTGQLANLSMFREHSNSVRLFAESAVCNSDKGRRTSAVDKSCSATGTTSRVKRL